MADERFFIGKLIGNYRLVAPIAAGAYGTVYRAEHQLITGRVVAVKMLHAYLESSSQREKFIKEAQLLELVHHPHMLPIFDAGFYNGVPYLITAYAAGGSLRDRLLKFRLQPLPPQEAVTILMQVGEALHHAHLQGIVHRDLKPENILFTEQGEALLADFGLASTLSSASMRQTAHVGGTPPYMAPEQFKGTVCRESDQYALACIAYEMVTGRRPFDAPDFIAMGFKHTTETPVPPSTLNPHLPRYIEQAILKAMAKKRADRFPHVLAFIQALQAPSSPFSTFKALPARVLHRPRQEQPQYSSNPLQRHNPLEIQQSQYLHKQQEQIAKSLADFERAIQFDPSYARTHNKKGLTLFQSQQYSKALAAFEQACLLDTTNAEYHNNRGRAFYMLGQYEAAIAAYDHAIAFAPNEASYRNYRGQALYQLKRYQEALIAFEQAILLDSAYAEYHNNRARTLYQLKRYTQALVASEKACQIDATCASYRLNRGDILFALQRYEEALDCYKQALRLEPDNGLCHARKAEALDMLGKRWQARQARAQARKLGYSDKA
ncbi:MAG: tetratricopeptide repeat protein [Ktedonobacteraceae bacterium]|nr:tetratricopeptide repeat protein [Ktedonobacteraceae bacterium]